MRLQDGKHVPLSVQLPASKQQLLLQRKSLNSSRSSSSHCHISSATSAWLETETVLQASQA
jgi:hypothetical protein